MTKAVIRGTFSDLKLVKTRSVAQLIVEVPIEQAKGVTDAFGFPIPGQEVPVAVARMQEVQETTLAPPVRKTPSLAERSAIFCQDPRFRKAMHETHRDKFQFDTLPTPEETAQFVRAHCGVESRAELNSNPKAASLWHQLEATYNAEGSL